MTQESYANRTLQQVKIGEETKKKLKLIALTKDEYLYTICDQALLSFIKFRKSVPHFDYLLSPSSGKVFSIWIDNDVLDKTRKRAEKDGVPVNRVLYASLVRYAAEN